MKTIGQLYQVVLDHFKISLWTSGICSIIIRGDNPLTRQERQILLKHFAKQRPTIFSKFWWTWEYNMFRMYGKDNSFWWSDTPKGHAQRKLFLAYLAKKYRGINLDGTINYTIP